jgi:hypothetical protein
MSIVRPVFFLLLLAFPGCTAPVADAPPATDTFAALKKDLSAEQVIALLGVPDSTKPFGAPTPAAEVWTYRRKLSESVSLVAIQTTEMPLMNPRTGQMGTVMEPVYQHQTITEIETVELLLVERRLVEWKRRRSTESAFH